MHEIATPSEQIQDGKLVRHKNIYKLVGNWETDVWLNQLIEMGPYAKREKKVYEATLFNLLNDVIKRSYQEGRKNALLSE